MVVEEDALCTGLALTEVDLLGWWIPFQEVERKKKALDRLEVALADMEATRIRKDR